MFRVGIVQAQDLVNAKVRVRFPDHDQMTSWWLFVTVPKTQNDKAYWMPDIGEQVLCLMDEHDEDGAVLGAVYSQVDTTPVQSADKWHLSLKDGAQFEYDRNSHQFLMQVPPLPVTISAGTPPGWRAQTQYWVGDLIVDSNGNTQQCLVAGKSGTSVPDWTPVLSALTIDNQVTWTLLVAGNGPVLVTVNGATLLIDAAGNINATTTKNINMTAAGTVNIAGTQGVNIGAGSYDQSGSVTVAADVDITSTRQFNAEAKQAVTVKSDLSTVVVEGQQVVTVKSDSAGIALNANQDLGVTTSTFGNSWNTAWQDYDAHKHPGVQSGSSVTGTTDHPVQ